MYCPCGTTSVAAAIDSRRNCSREFERPSSRHRVRQLPSKIGPAVGGSACLSCACKGDRLQIAEPVDCKIQ
jgi:hypothetical protein